MSLPTTPTLTLIVNEGLKRAGYPSGGSATQQTQAEGWVEETKWDIWSRLSGKRLKALMATSYGVTADGVSRYALPSDFESFYSLAILDGVNTGTASAVSASSVTLGAAVGEDFIQGKLLLLTSGTGVGNCSQVSSYATLVASLTPNFNGSSFDGTEKYMIVDSIYKLKEKELIIKDLETDYSVKGRPEYYFPFGQANSDSDETGEFELFNTPDDIYGVQLRYFVNLSLTDLASNLMATLYRRWYAVWIQGVIYRALQQDRESNRATLEYQKYQKMVSDLINGELYDASISTLQARIEA